MRWKFLIAHHRSEPGPLPRIFDAHSWWGTTTLLTLILFLLLFALQVHRNPLRWDEVDYFQCMENVVLLGLPIYYAGEVDVDHSRLMYISTRHLAGQDFVFYRYRPETGILKETFFALVNDKSRYTFGMWHPLLYIYLGSLVFRAFPLNPDNSHLLRYFNLIFSIGTFAGMMALTRELYPARYRQVFSLALMLYTLDSLAVRGSILIDYNATLGPCVTTWFVTAYLNERNRGFSWRLAILTALAFLTSLGIALNLVIGTLIYVFLIYRHQRPWRSITAIIAGIVGFLFAFWIFCHIYHLPFSQPFLHNFARVGPLFTLSWLIQQFSKTVRYIRVYSREIGLPTVIITAALLPKTIITREISRTPVRGFLPIVIATGLISHASLGAEAYGFMKYILFLLPLLFVYLAGEELTLLQSTSRLWKLFAVVTVAFVVIASTANSVEIMKRQSGGTLYDTGTQGIISVAQQVEAISTPDEIILSDKDVAFFAKRKFVQWSRTYLADISSLHNKIAEERIRYVVINLNTLNTFPELSAYVNEQFIVRGRAGSYVLLTRKY